MSEFNPYAPPEASIAPNPEAAPPAPSDLYRDGGRLVLRRGAELPPRCLRCNAPAGSHWVTQQLTFYYLWWPFVRRVRIASPLCSRHDTQRLRYIALAGLLTLLGLGLALLAFLPRMPRSPIPLIGFLLFLLGIGMVNWYQQVIISQQINDRFVWLDRVCPAFLAELPDWRARGRGRR